MNHCRACDCLMEEHELKRKGLHSGEPIDLCDACFREIEEDVPVTYDLLKAVDE